MIPIKNNDRVSIPCRSFKSNIWRVGIFSKIFTKCFSFYIKKQFVDLLLKTLFYEV